MLCPCCSNKTYADCCEPFHLNLKKPKTALQLMRSRYCAYAIPNGEYLMETTFPSKRKYHDVQEMENWGKQNTWTRLEIVDFSENMVKFKAFFTTSQGKSEVHHEKSTFKKVLNIWYYVSGEFSDE